MAVTSEIKNITISDGIGQATASQNTRVYAYTVPSATTSGTDTTPTANRVYTTAIFIPANMTLTGLSYLIGSVGGTDLAIAMLFNSEGVLVANSAVAGATVGTTATMQHLAFTAPYAAKGPALYFAGIQVNGTTCRLRTQVFGDHPTAIFAQTWATPVSMTSVPTTFTTAYGPIVMTY